MRIRYTDNINELQPEALNGFFTGWVSHPSPKTHIELMKKSYKVWLALDKEKCVGFVNALSDGVFYTYIPLLEVLPEYRGQGIGSKLMEKMLESLNDMYAVDIICDKDVSSFYAKKGFFNQCVGMVKRNYHNQNAPSAQSLLDKAISATEKTVKTIEKPRHGGLHHIEIYVSDLQKSRKFWFWLLEKLDYKLFQEWEEGFSLEAGSCYLVFVQTTEKHLAAGYNRCRTGLNHLAFHAKNRDFIDQLRQELLEKGIKLLYDNKYPYASGEDYYALYFEDPDRIKVELVAP